MNKRLDSLNVSGLFSNPLPIKLTSILSVTVFMFSPAFSVSALAQTALSAPTIRMTTLPSGQQVYVQEIHSQPIVTIDTWVDTGSAQETQDINGVSHFLEHLLFKGTATHPVGDIDRTLESKGADFNAATSDDFTHFHITTATPYFNQALKLHADMLLNATINPPELTRERKVVQEEINRALDNPGRKAVIALDEELYTGHPYAMDTLGPTANIQNIPRESILAYYHKWYQPANFKTVIAGDINADEAIKQVNEAFQTAYREQPHPAPGVPAIYPVTALTHPMAKTISDPNVSQDTLDIGFLAPPQSDVATNAALDVAAIILGQGESSRLYQHIKEDKQLVTSISANNSTQQQSGTFIVSAQLKPKNRQAVEKAILEEIAQFRQAGPTADELQKAKTQVVKDFAFLNESTEGVAQSIGYAVTIGKLSDYTEYVATVQKVTAAQVQAAAQKYLNPQQAAIAAVVPGAANADNAAQALEDSTVLNEASRQSGLMPSNLTQGRSTVSGPESSQTIKTVLSSGATLLVKPTPNTQTVAFTIFVRGGQLAETKPGTADLMARVLTKGTPSRSNAELSRELERLGLSLVATSGDDALQINGTCLSDSLDKLLLITQDVVNHPVFPAAEVEKERANLLEEIKTQADQPGPLMFEKLSQNLYPHHPYGDTGERLAAGVKTVTRADLIQFYYRLAIPKNLVISVVGNVDPDAVRTAFEQITNGLPSSLSPVTVASLPKVAPLAKNTVISAQKPEQAATWIGYGWLAPQIAAHNRDYFALKLVNTLLGAGLSSRLFVDLREKQGLAYHVSTQYPSTLETSRFIMYIGTNPSNQEAVLKGFDVEIKRLQTEPLTATELADAKSKLIGLFALAHESNASQAYYQGIYETLGVGYQFDKAYPDLVNQVTGDDVQRVAQTYFSRPKVTVIVAPKAIRTDQSVKPNLAPNHGSH